DAVQVSDFFTLDLDGRAIRDLTETEDGNYLISAGSADDSGNFAVYGWTGEIDEAPVESVTELGLEGWSGSYESITGATALADGVVVRVLQDAGTVDIYGTGTEAQDLTREFMKFPSHEYVLDFDGAFEDEVAQPEITLSRSEVAQGDTFEVTGSGFPADEEVEFVLHSDPLELGSTVTTDTGALAATLTVPAGAPVGAHTLTASTASTASGVVVSVPLAVLAGQGGGAGGAGDAGAGGAEAGGAGAGDSGSLANTGGNDFAAIGIAAVALLVLGGTLLVLRRRFRAEDASEG
ncbi:MAG: LPXTG cell wall anchor domain-containing protein, partial [Leucobacter sp.]